MYSTSALSHLSLIVHHSVNYTVFPRCNHECVECHDHAPHRSPALPTSGTLFPVLFPLPLTMLMMSGDRNRLNTPNTPKRGDQFQHQIHALAEMHAVPNVGIHATSQGLHHQE